MTIHEFIEREQLRLENFKSYWALNTELDREQFPDELEPGEWDAQLKNAKECFNHNQP